jgi:hypothetical protein
MLFKVGIENIVGMIFFYSLGTWCVAYLKTCKMW